MLDSSDEEHNEYEIGALPDLDAILPENNVARITSTEEVAGMHHEEAIKLMRSMNIKQRQIFTEVRKWCSKKATGENVEPFHIFLSGGAGSGKSHVIKAVQYEAKKLLTPLTDSADEVTVLLVAYTGTAAFNIGGQTIHSAFNVRVNTSRMRASSKYDALGEDLLTSLRAKYKHLQIVIVDEVSMVGKKMLHTMSERLAQIKRCNAPFGNVSILAVGDFYQIPPVGDSPLYKDDNASICVSPWHKFTLWNLTEIMRQKDDQTYAMALNRYEYFFYSKVSNECINLMNYRFVAA